MKRTLSRSLLLSLPIASVLTYVAVREGVSRLSPGERLAIRWEGAVIDRNHRDIGASLNDCLGSDRFRPGVAHRANVWFSGWSCASVGDPDVIYSLNYFRPRDERYYCRRDGQNLVGRSFQTDDLQLHDLEFVTTWAQADMRAVACAFIQDSFSEISRGRRILVHCDAGKDRTGTYAALLAAVTAELNGGLSPSILDAIECDYRKSKRLEPAKYGRMRRFLEELTRRGGVGHFLEETCALDRSTLVAVAKRFGRPEAR